MASSKKLNLLNFFGVKTSRRFILICLRCGSENLRRSEDRIECLDCKKILSLKIQ
ncbi:MAG: hypothetical protein KGI33_00630 [Thaumarchaeota archaeon]|nr:hypothetical protein [Nitrososphaerota archaeon]